MSDNPYSPSYQPPTPDQERARASQGNPLMIPAIILLVLSSIWLLYGVFNFFFALTTGPPPTPPNAAPGTEEGKIFGFYAAVIGIPIAALVTMLGSIQMIRLRSYGLAMAGAVFSIIPICSSCLIVGIPFGIWALILLMREDVKSRFS